MQNAKLRLSKTKKMSAGRVVPAIPVIKQVGTLALDVPKGDFHPGYLSSHSLRENLPGKRCHHLRRG